MGIRDEMRTQWLSADGLLRIEGWAREGLTDEQLAGRMGIARCTLYEWKQKHKALRDAIKSGKAPVDTMVENALLKSALGFENTVRKAIKVDDKIVYVNETTYYPPNTAAAIFWLKNRRPDRWRDKPVEEKAQGESTIDILTRELFEMQRLKAESDKTDI